MFPGESGPVTFRAKKYLLNDIIDWFGGGVTFFDETEEEVSVRVRVNYAAMRRWALQYALHAKLLSPESLVKQVGEGPSGGPWKTMQSSLPPDIMWRR